MASWGMNTVLPPNSSFYLLAALAWVAIYHIILPALSLWTVRHWLWVPAIVLHEFAHWLVACFTLCFPRVHFKSGVDEDGVAYGACVKFAWCPFGRVADMFISAAPFLGGLGLAWYIADLEFSREHSIWAAFFWIALFCWAIECAVLTSNSDYNGMGFFGRLVFLYALVLIFVAGFIVALAWSLVQVWPWLEPYLLPWLVSFLLEQIGPPPGA